MVSSELRKIISCVQVTSSDVRCGGALTVLGERLFCQKCSCEYPVVRAVPTIKSKLDVNDSWYIEIYKRRSRTADLATPTLPKELNFMSEFVKGINWIGPCLE